MIHSEQDPIEFIEIGVGPTGHAEAVKPMIANGVRGVFVDADQEWLIKCRAEMANNPAAHKNHVFICALIMPENKLNEFFKSEADYSCVFEDHVVAHARGRHDLANIKKWYFWPMTLNQLLEAVGRKDLPLLNVDCERMDCPILTATDFSVYRPRIIVFEDGHSEGFGSGRGPIYHTACEHLEAAGYRVSAIGHPDSMAVLPENNLGA